MRIRSISKEHTAEPVAVYDVINANPYNNFLVKTRTSGRWVVAHNCMIDEV